MVDSTHPSVDFGLDDLALDRHIDLAYTVRESQRALRVSLRVLPTGQVEVVTPSGFDCDRLPALIQEHQPWLHQAIARVLDRRARLGDLPRDQLALNAVGETWTIKPAPPPTGSLPASSLADRAMLGDRCPQFDRGSLAALGDLGQGADRGVGSGQPSAGLLGKTTRRSRRRADQLQIDEASQELIYAAHLGEAALVAQLRCWLADRARVALVACLDTTSDRLGLSYQRAIIRGQKQRWGSCSSHGTISLNWKLLFLPTNLVQHVCIHELCHRRHLNHSADFWNLVAQCDPQWRSHRLAMKTAWQYIPPWLD